MRIWRNWTPHTLLTGTQNGTATVGNSLAVPKAELSHYLMTAFIDI